MKMNAGVFTLRRRDFLLATASLVVAPSLSVGSGIRCERFFDHSPDTFVPDKIRISKGPYLVEHAAACGQDLRDCHGLCATVEWAQIIKDALEYSPESLDMMFSLGWDEQAIESRKRLRESLRRTTINKQEYLVIYSFLKDIRGPHDCVYA